MEPDEDALAKKLEAVADATSFLAFVHALVADREAAAARERAQPASPYGPDAGSWENDRVETFLAAAVRWAESTNIGLAQGLRADNPWRRFAQFLYLGKIYE